MNTALNRTRIVFAMAIMLVAASATAAQEGGKHGDRKGHRGPPDAEMRVAKMTQMLELSDEQSAELLVVMQQVDQEREVLHERMMEQMKPEMCDLHLRTEAEISSILTPEQQALMEEKKASRNEKGHGRPGRGWDKLDCSEFE